MCNTVYETSIYISGKYTCNVCFSCCNDSCISDTMITITIIIIIIILITIIIILLIIIIIIVIVNLENHAKKPGTICNNNYCTM